MREKYSEGSFTLESAVVVPLLLLIWVSGILLMTGQTVNFIDTLKQKDWKIAGDTAVYEPDCGADGCEFIRNADTAGKYIKKIAGIDEGDSTDGEEGTDSEGDIFGEEGTGIWKMFVK